MPEGQVREEMEATLFTGHSTGTAQPNGLFRWSSWAPLPLHSFPDISGIIRGILSMNMWAITMMWSQKSQFTQHQQPGRLTQIMPWPAKGFYACKEWDYVKHMRFQSSAEALFAHFHWKAGGGKCLGKQYECCCCRESMGNSDKYLIKLVSNIITIKSNLFNFLYAWLSLHTQKDVNWQPSF